VISYAITPAIALYPLSNANKIGLGIYAPKVVLPTLGAP